MLTQVDADKILATPKFVIDKGKHCNTFHLDLVKNKKYRIYLTPADSIDCPKEYLLDIGKNKVLLNLYFFPLSSCLQTLL